MCERELLGGILANKLSRRDLGTLALGAAAGVAVAGPALAAGTVERNVTFKTADGEADAILNLPAGRGRWPAIIVWPDAGSLRPPYSLLNSRIAAEGFVVISINPYYRWAKAPVAAPGEFDPKKLEAVYAMARRITASMNNTDAQAVMAYLDTLPEVDKSRPIGVHGYCLGGPIMMRTAASFPQRVRAGASFHGARLVSDSSDSPHLLASRLQGEFLFAIAENDDKQDPEAKNVLRRSFEAAKVPAKIEVYDGAMHGWSIPGNPTYNQAASEKGLAEVIALYKRRLSA